MKKEFQIISELIENNTRVLDVGCGDGTLMKFLKDEKNVDTRGLEISKENVQNCISKGLSIIEGNAEKDLHQFPNLSFDYVVLSQTLQAFYNPEKVIEDLLRVANKAIDLYNSIFFLEQKLKKSFIVHICRFGVLYHSFGKVSVKGIVPFKSKCILTFQ